MVSGIFLVGCNHSETNPSNYTVAKSETDTGEPWRSDQLMPPADLAALIEANDPKVPLIISIGPSAEIKGAVDIGPANEKDHLEALKKYLEGVPKDQNLVIYCGCCPFSPCPNVRPAFTLLNEMGFTNHKLLNLGTNLKTDWINHGYPLQE